jgi:phosphoribosylaminoimidazolecarboxamide formyltransferase/IMP cyclohydrolase
LDVAKAVLKRAKTDRCRLFANEALFDLDRIGLDTTPRFRYVRGGFLVQPNYTWTINLSRLEVIGRALTAQQKADLALAWAVCATSNSNTITLTKNSMVIGNGVGQQDRVECCELAVRRATQAGHDPHGAVAASDSFFPFPDGPEVLAAAGVQVIFATSGSIRDAEVQAFCREFGVTLCVTPDVEGRGFFGH